MGRISPVICPSDLLEAREEVCKYGMTKDCGLIVNASRSIIYAGSDEDFADAARAEALNMQQQMQAELEKAGII